MNIALEPTTVSSNAASTGPWPSTRISAMAPPPLGDGTSGSAYQRVVIATKPSPAMPQNAVRHPSISPNQVASGTPPMVARVNPMNMAATAPARFSGGTKLAATIEPMPKNAPWFSEVTTRATSRLA
ncbi:Uncharacterised protein [Pseudomonas putida]|nr:Uncharacterised protein [Pseudomonas putida]CAB5718703.1 Uncharacterised protein [Pseudomonas putida]CAB5723047.1 Uncharacterised protein [Pseudomonas putida]